MWSEEQEERGERESGGKPVKREEAHDAQGPVFGGGGGFLSLLPTSTSRIDPSVPAAESSREEEKQKKKKQSRLWT